MQEVGVKVVGSRGHWSKGSKLGQKVKELQGILVNG
jgi:hypothetical protein